MTDRKREANRGGRKKERKTRKRKMREMREKERDVIKRERKRERIADPVNFDAEMLPCAHSADDFVRMWPLTEKEREKKNSNTSACSINMLPKFSFCLREKEGTGIKNPKALAHKQVGVKRCSHSKPPL